MIIYIAIAVAFFVLGVAATFAWALLTTNPAEEDRFWRHYLRGVHYREDR